MHHARVVPHVPTSDTSIANLEECLKKGTKPIKKYSIIDQDDVDFPILLDPVHEKEKTIEVEAMYSQQLYPTPKGRLRWFEPSYLIMSLALAADTANIVDFPVLCYKHGGFAFFIPYTIMICFCVLPVFFMEAIIGQYTRAGAIKVWKLCPIFQGIGWCMMIFNLYDILESQARIAWAGKYLTSVVNATIRGTTPPYFGCDNDWNTQSCKRFIDSGYPSPDANPAAEFFERKVVERYSGNSTYNVDELGPLVPHLLICHTLFYGFIIIVLLLGMRWTVRLAWVAFALGIIGIFVTFIRGSALPGGWSGIKIFSESTDITKLGSLETWEAATRYSFYSCSIGIGIHLTFSSFNDFGQPILRNCILVVVIDTLFSVFSTLGVFSFFGYLAYRSGKKVQSELFERDPVIYKLFPNTIATLETQDFFISTIFVSIICTGLFNIIVRLSYIIQCVLESFRGLFDKYPFSKHALPIGIPIIMYFAGFPGFCRGGIFLVQIYDDIFESVSQMLIIFIQVIAIGWIYGIQGLNDCHRAMTGKSVNIVFLVMWKITAPIGILVVLAFSCLRLAAPSRYDRQEVRGGQTIKIIISILPALIVPIFSAVRFFLHQAPTWKMKFCLLISPEYDHERILLDEDAPRAHLKHYLSFGNGPMGLTVNSNLDMDLDDLETGWILEPEANIDNSEIDDFAFSEYDIDIDDDYYVGEADFIFLYEKDTPVTGKTKKGLVESDSDDAMETQLNKIPLNSRVKFILRKVNI